LDWILSKSQDPSLSLGIFTVGIASLVILHKMTDIYTSADADNDSAADGNDSEFLRFFLHFQLWQHLDSADFCCTFPKQTLATSTQLAPSSELSSRFLTNLQKHQNAKRVISIKCQKSNH